MSGLHFACRQSLRLVARRLALALLAATAPGLVCAQQGDPKAGLRHHHGGPTLYVTQLAATKTVPPNNSAATGTGAFIVDPEARTLRYAVTFHGLESGPPKIIALYNFGAGGNGELLQVLCGTDERPCPKASSARIEGQWPEAERAKFDAQLLRELATGRLYVQIAGRDGAPELRAQLEPNGSMAPVRNFVAHLKPRGGRESDGVGTAVYSEVQLPRGRVEVFYQLTVTGTVDAPTGAAIVSAPGSLTIQGTKSLTRVPLPKLQILSTTADRRGATMAGTFQTRAGIGAVPLAALPTGRSERSVVIMTRRYPDGELVGVLEQVR